MRDGHGSWKRAAARLSILVFTILVSAGPASARRSDAHAYRFDQVWSSAIRLLRVDYRFPVRDRDREIGYLLFDYTHQGRSYPGSLELVPFEERGQTKVRITLSIPAMPAYIERMVLDKLGRKLREDHGDPLPPPPSQPVRERLEEPEEEEDDHEEEPEDQD